jgi:hypothetical protein
MRCRGEEAEVETWPNCPHRDWRHHQDEGARNAEPRGETPARPGCNRVRSSVLTSGRLLARFHLSRQASGFLTGTAGRWGRVIDADRAPLPLPSRVQPAS